MAVIEVVIKKTVVIFAKIIYNWNLAGILKSVSLPGLSPGAIQWHLRVSLTYAEALFWSVKFV